MAISTIGTNGIDQTGTNLATTSGNVGIGTASPAVALDISSTANSTSGQLRIASNGSNGTRMGFISTSTNGKTYQIGSNFITGTGEFGIYDATAAATRMVIDSSGNLLVGTSSPPSGDKVVIQQTVATAFAQRIIGINNGGTYRYTVFNAGAGGTQTGYIQSDGTTTTYATSSDYRLKENIAPMTGALNVVQQLKPVTYSWKADGSNGQGFIAHELAEVVPDCVTGEKDAVDADGNPIYQGIDTSFLVATLTAAIQELNAKVDAQAAEIAALKGAK